MKVISKRPLPIDVDDTLITYDGPGPEIFIPDPYDGKFTKRFAHLPHCKLLKNHKARGAYIIVWSQNGHQWAEAVIKALELENFVDLVIDKPETYVDDLPAQEWMGKRMYLDPNHKFGGG